MSIAIEAQVVVPDEFTHALEAERGRWLRRRFMLLCTVSILLGLLMFGGEDRQAIDAVRGHGTMPVLAGWLLLLQYVLSILLNAAALVFVWRRNPPRQTLVLLAMWLAILTSLCDQVLLRLVIEAHPDYLELDEAMSAALTWAIAGPTTLLMWFTLVSLFIPWTVREAVRPAVVVVAIAAGLTLVDIMTGRLGLWGALSVPFAALAVMPGIAICWWRYSRFQRWFRLRFESLAYRSLQGELNSARNILNACLPPRRGAGPVRLEYVYEPMRQIGGDMLFVHPAGDDGAPVVSMVLLDVTGHGIAAALTVNRLVGELQRLFAEDGEMPPGELLHALNRYVHLMLSSHGIYVTALCLRIDAASDRLEWASAGHPPAFVARKDGSFETLESTTVPLGVFDSASFDPEMMSKRFERGDSAVLYTDGAIEARDPAGRQLGVAGLASMLRALPGSAADWPALILRQLGRHRAAPPEDDTLVAVAYRK